ncbi:hypothetical protein D3C85_1073480 [compost metagenome]
MNGPAPITLSASAPYLSPAFVTKSSRCGKKVPNASICVKNATGFSSLISICLSLIALTPSASCAFLTSSGVLALVTASPPLIQATTKLYWPFVAGSNVRLKE